MKRIRYIIIAIVILVLAVDYYTTNYVSGSTVNLTRCSDNKVFTVNLD